MQESEQRPAERDKLGQRQGEGGRTSERERKREGAVLGHAHRGGQLEGGKREARRGRERGTNCRARSSRAESRTRAGASASMPSRPSLLALRGPGPGRRVLYGHTSTGSVRTHKHTETRAQCVGGHPPTHTDSETDSGTDTQHRHRRRHTDTDTDKEFHTNTPMRAVGRWAFWRGQKAAGAFQAPGRGGEIRRARKAR